MTTEEAILEFEKQLHSAVVVLDSGFGTHPGESDRIYRKRKAMAEIALSALRAQQELEENEPLTLIQINQHISGALSGDIEPLYVVLILPTSTYALGWCTAYELIMLLHCKEDYGKIWLAYRRKPKEG